MLDVQTFLCPNCKQFINSSMTVCKFCNVELDPATIVAQIETQDKVNEAYNSASRIRILAGALFTFFLLSFLPFVGFIARYAFYIMFLAVPVFMLVWAIKYSGTRTHDPDFKTAKKYLWVAMFIWLAFPVAYVILLTLLFLGIMAASQTIK
jgi:hypothetical protein